MQTKKQEGLAALLASVLLTATIGKIVMGLSIEATVTLAVLAAVAVYLTVNKAH